MKHFKTFEAYISYDKMGSWGSPEDIKVELERELNNLFKFGGISNQLKDLIYTDQSTDKGIKWEIDVKGKGSDIIHAYKNGKMRGDYEWFLNKKKSSKADIQDYFLSKYVSKVEQYYSLLKNFDIDKKYHKHFKSQDEYNSQVNNLKDLYNSMSDSEKKKAHKQYVKAFKKDVEFSEFKGY